MAALIADEPPVSEPFLLPRAAMAAGDDSDDRSGDAPVMLPLFRPLDDAPAPAFWGSAGLFLPGDGSLDVAVCASPGTG